MFLWIYPTWRFGPSFGGRDVRISGIYQEFLRFRSSPRGRHASGRSKVLILCLKDIFANASTKRRERAKNSLTAGAYAR